MRNAVWRLRAIVPCVLAAALLLLAGGLGVEAAEPCPAEGWVLAVPEPNPTKPTTLGAISGLVALEGDRFVAAHDAKRKFDAPPPALPATRLHRLTVRPDGTVDRLPLAWPGTQANDLE